MFLTNLFVAEQIVELYTTALKSNPNNEEFHTHLFMALVRVGDYKRQQQVKYVGGWAVCVVMTGLVAGHC